MTIATLILAAGGSTRLGQPKQLLTHDGQTLVRRMAEAALSLRSGTVVVVLGADAERIGTELANVPVQTVLNGNWQTGMASSLRAGLNALTDEPFEAFLVLLTDQPYVTADLLRQLIDARQQTGRGIVACRYGDADHPGVPALFDVRYRPVFLNLTGDVGARNLIRQHADDVVDVSFPLGVVDLDTAEDVAKWQDS